MGPDGFAGKTVLVTGGARGVGGFITEEFAARGAHVIVNYFHSERAARDLVRDLTARGLSAQAVRASMAKPEHIKLMIEQVRDEHGGLDVLVNNAARGVFLPLQELAEEDWQRALDLNLHAVRRCSLAALPLLAARPGSSVVNVSSLGSQHVAPTYGLVGVTKAAMECLSRYLAVEFAPHGVRVNVAACQIMDNRVGDLFPDAERVKQAARDSTPWGRLPTETDLARAVVMLAGPEAGFVTGQTILADGGLSTGAGLHAPTAVPRSAQTTSAASAAQIAAAPVSAVPDAPATPPTPEVSGDPIAVIGTGLLLPEAESPEQFWEVLRDGRPVFSDQGSRYPMEHFYSADPSNPDTTYTSMAGVIDQPTLHPRAREVPGASPAEHWIRHTVLQALGDRAVPSGGRTSLYFAGWPDGTREMEEGVLRGQLLGSAASAGIASSAVDGPLDAVLPHATGEPGRFLPANLLRGALTGLVPEDADCLAVDAACASGLYAVDLAARALRSGAADLALATGLSLCTVRYMILFSKVTGLSRSGDVRAFDEKADGTLFSDSVATVALKRLSDARRDGDRVLAVLDGFGGSSDGRGKGIYAPNAAGQRLALERAYAGRGMDDVGWVIGHATGTPAGDQAELAALAEQFADRPVVCTGNKSLVGHGGWTSGLISLIHAVLGLEHGMIPPQARFESPPAEGFPAGITVPGAPIALPSGAAAGRRRVGVSAFGFGGINAHQVLTDDLGTSAAPRLEARGGPLVLVGWSALLPGSDDSGGSLAALRGGGYPRSFGETYPAPPFSAVRLPPRSVRAVDRTQLMALQLMQRLEADHGALWKQAADRTCVIAAHSGPTRLSQELSVRCFATALDSAFAGAVPQVADWWRAYRSALTERVAPISEDSLPGLLQSVIAGRVANLHDVHGPSFTTDTGRTSGRSAYAVAERYLREGECELALVLGTHGNVLPGCGRLFGVEDSAVAEGGFLLALCTEKTAAEHGWQVLAESPDSLADLPAPTSNADRCFGGADDLAALLRTLVPDPSSDAAAQASTREDSPRLLRFELTADPERHAQHRAEPVDALPPGCLILAEDMAIADALAAAAHDAGAILAVTDPRAPEALRLATPVTEDAIRELVWRAGSPAHLRIFATPSAVDWPGRPRPSLIAAQEAAFLALRELREPLAAGGSAVACLLDPQTGGIAHPHGALFTGMFKSAVWDLPGAWLHALTTDASATEALRLIAEASRLRPEIPVSFVRHGLRHTETLVPSDLTTGAVPRRDLLDRDSVVVAVGGARGITASILDRLARKHGSRLWLIGSSDVDAVSPDLRAEPAEVFRARRRAFIADLLRSGQGLTPGEAVRRFDALASAHEAARNVDRLTAVCGPGRVRYLRADITDPDQIRAAAARITAESPEIDLLVNAAGLHQPSGLATKKLEVFRRIRDVKLLGYHGLREAFDDVPVRQWCNFGSITGVLGLPGEIDYAAANDLLGAAARAGRHDAERTEFAVAWTLWAESGMATRALVGDAVKRRGHVSSVSDEVGSRHFLELIRAPQPWLPGVVQVGEAERRFMAPLMPSLAAAARNTPAADPGAYLGTPRWRGVGAVEWDFEFDSHQVRLVSEHPVAGLPTLPATLVLALIAEAAAGVAPGARVDVLRDVRYHRFVRARSGGPVRHTVRAELTAPRTVRVVISSTTFAPDGRILNKGALHTEAFVELDARPRPPVLPPPPVDGEMAYDPYCEPGSPIPLHGAFINTTDHRVTSRGGRSVWRPRSRPDATFYGRMNLPALLIDALARTHALAPAGSADVAVSAPTALDRLEIFQHGNDLTHFEQHPEGIQLIEDQPSGLFLAATMSGEPLLSFRGLRVYRVGGVDVGSA